MSEEQLTVFYLQLGLLAVFARLGGECFRRFQAPAVLGEVVAGLILGPTVLRHVIPAQYALLFPPHGPNTVALEAITNLAAILFLLAAGLEVELSLIRQEGRSALITSLAGIVVPLAVGSSAAFYWPQLFGKHVAGHTTVFALFIGVALSITALPILAKTLLDLNLYRTSFGMSLIAAAVLDDLIGWILFGIVLALDHIHDAGALEWGPIGRMIILTLGFAGLMVTAGRWAGDRFLRLGNRYCAPNGSIIGLILGLGLLAACFTQHIGVHGLFGAFLLGVALGGSPHLQHDSREAIARVVSNFLAPLLFASVGLKVDFIANFNLAMVALVLGLACVGKITACTLAAHWLGAPARTAWAIGFGMNSRGSMEIILGVIALQEGIIDESLFVALSIMAMATSLVGGLAIRHLMGTGKAVEQVLSPAVTPVTQEAVPAGTAREEEAEVVAAKVQRLSKDGS